MTFTNESKTFFNALLRRPEIRSRFLSFIPFIFIPVVYFLGFFFIEQSILGSLLSFFATIMVTSVALDHARRAFRSNERIRELPGGDTLIVSIEKGRFLYDAANAMIGMYFFIIPGLLTAGVDIYKHKGIFIFLLIIIGFIFSYGFIREKRLRARLEPQEIEKPLFRKRRSEA